MRITIITPRAANIRTGNRCTADQWAGVLRSFGHEVEVMPVCVGTEGSVDREADKADVLIALHAVRSSELIRRFRTRHPEGRIVLVLTGTDLYGEPSPEGAESMAVADRIVVLQDRALPQVPPEFRGKTRVIVQSASVPVSARAAGSQGARSLDPFDICVACHLREVKDPLRTAAAARLLPPASRIRIRHAGAILEEAYRPLVEHEMRENPRYEWLGEVGGERLAALMASCQATVITSRLEGGARVAGESIMLGTPVISSHVDGMIGLLGEDYPALFPYGDSRALSELLGRLESDAGFREDLRHRTAQLAWRFDPARERSAWAALLDELAPRPAESVPRPTA